MRPTHLGLTATAVSLTLLLSSCVDAPSAPDTAPGSGPFVIAPVFSLVTPTGPAVSPAQASALSDVFDRVDRFRVIVSKAGSGDVVLDTLIAVTPGADEYDLQVNVTAAAGESFLLTLVALEGTTELFRAESIPVQATVPGGTGSEPPAPVNIPLTYTGPGATAVSVEVAPGQTVLGPGGTAQMGVKVLDPGGAVIADAPVSWSSTVEGVATVGASGAVAGVGDGVAEVVATSPTGLTGRAWVYVVSGTLAYVQDGVLKVRTAAGGEAQARSSGDGASGPTWAGDDLYYAEGGAVRKAGSSATLLNGAWPSVSPDGGKIAADAGGSIVFANIDGTNETPGPSGSTPIWTDWSTLVVGGGSIQQVRADGTSRSTLVSGDAALPAFSNGGTLAYVSGGNLMVQGQATPLAEVGGRPSWSPDGAWIAAPGGGGLLLIPTDGSAPPVALPDLGGASDPAWQGTSVGGGSPPPLNLTGLSPDPAVPGQEVSILGSGFDWIIPENNKVFWPGPDGALEGEVLSVTDGAIGSVLPRNVVAGQIRVENRQGTAVLEYVPALGFLEIHARTPWDAPVSGVGITLLDGSGNEAAKGTTDGEGAFVSGALMPGDYTVQIGVPTGFALDGATTRSLTIPAAVSTLDLTLTPSVASVKLTPAQPTLGILDEVGVSVTPFDVNGDPIPEVSSVSWASGSSKLDVWDGGLSTTIVGRQPSSKAGDAGFAVTIDGVSFGFAATVTSSIQGTITNAKDGSPAQGVVVELERDEKDVEKTKTDAGGRYAFTGLLAGTYVVEPEPDEGMGSPSPAEAAVQLGPSTPRGQADFQLVEGYGEVTGEVIVFGDINIWDDTYFRKADNKTLTQNLVTNGSRTRTVWYKGHYSWGGGGGSEALAFIEGVMGTPVEQVTTGITGGLTIPSDAASFWIWTPQDPLDANDLAAIKGYVEGGGRVILIGEDDSPTADLTNQVVQATMAGLGSSATYVDNCHSPAHAGTPNSADPLMAGVGGVYFACTSDFALGAGDVSLVTMGEATVVIRLNLGAPVGAPPALLAAPSPLGPPASTRDGSSGDPSLGPVAHSDGGRIRRNW